MEADRDGNSAGDFEYIECPWGDLIYGSKKQLQALGVGVGMPFPGEGGTTRRDMVVTDPRGFKVTLKLADWRGPGVFTASIAFPGRDNFPRRGGEPKLYAPGVTKSVRAPRHDEYMGTQEALAAAGLARVDQFPGQPGMRKVRVTIFADGTVPTGAPTANHRESRQPGSKLIERTSKSTYRISVTLAADEGEARWCAYLDADREWERRMAALPRPARLTAAAGWRVIFNAAPTRTARLSTPSLSLVKRTARSDAHRLVPEDQRGLV